MAWRFCSLKKQVDQNLCLEVMGLGRVWGGSHTHTPPNLGRCEEDLSKERRGLLCTCTCTCTCTCVKNPKMKGLFPPNYRTHNMTPRHHEHFQVFRANTERMKQSPIISMQKLLNENIRKKIENDKLWNNWLVSTPVISEFL